MMAPPLVCVNDAVRGGRTGASASTNGRAGENRGATCRVRLDEQLAADELQTFFHAGQAEAEAFRRRVDVEADAFITNGEIEDVPGAAKMHTDMSGAAVSYGVVQGLLQDAEEAKRHVRRQAAGNILVAEIDLGACLPG